MTNTLVLNLLQQAVGLHQAGRLAEAEQLYDRVLASDHKNADALNLKGVIATAQGRQAEALKLFDRSIAARKSFPDVHFNRANTLIALDRADEALAGYEEALRLRPDYADAYVNAGLLLRKLNRSGDSLAVFRRMAARHPNDPRAHYGIALALVMAGDASPEPRTVFTRAINLAPQDADIRFSLAIHLAGLGEIDAAIGEVRAALALRPAWPEALSNLGEWLKMKDDFAEAISVQRRALALQPLDPTLRFNLAQGLVKANEPGEAEQLLRGVIESHPEFAKAYVNLGNICKDRGDFNEALDLFERALDLDPALYQNYTNLGAVFAEKGWFATSLILHDKRIALKDPDPTTYFNRAVTRLQMGRLAEGWSDYDRRFEAPKEYCERRPSPPAYWQDEDLRDKRLLIWTEQGIGDEVIYASMIPEIAARAKHCVLECSTRLAPVFARSFPGVEVVGYKDYKTRVSPANVVDYQVSLASLGRHLRSSFESFPKHTGYLKADPARAAALRTRYRERVSGGPVIGISWRSKNVRIGENKSMTLADLAPILRTPGATFVNLQYGDCAADLAEVRATFGVDVIHDAEIDPLKDMDAFFAQVAAMDAVVSTSNTTVHVAGSLNVPTWVLLPYAKGALWYWFATRTDSPWYPSVRLIREKRLDPSRSWWGEGVGQAADEIAAWVRNKS